MMLVKILLLIAMVFSVIVFWRVSVKNGNFIKNFFISGIIGFGSLILIWIIGKFSFELLSINWASVLCSWILGIPGVILMLLTKLIWIL